MKVLFGSCWIVSWLFCLELDICLESYFDPEMFGMVRCVVPEWCLSHSSTYKFYLRVVKIPATELSLREGKIPATEFGSMSLSSGGYPNYRVMFSRL